MAKNEDVNVRKLKKFYNGLVKNNEGVTFDFFKKKSILSSEYIEDLKVPAGYSVVGDKIYYKDEVIGTFRVNKIGSDAPTSTSTNVDIDNIDIAPKNGIFTKVKDFVVGIFNRPASEELQEKIKEAYDDNIRTINRLLSSTVIKYLTQAEINSLRRFYDKYEENLDNISSIFISNRKSKKYLKELEFENNVYFSKFNKNMEIKRFLDKTIQNLEEINLQIDPDSKYKKIIIEALKTANDLDDEINNKYDFNQDEVMNKIDKIVDFLKELKKDIKDEEETKDKKESKVIDFPQPMAAPEPVEAKPLEREDLKEFIEKESKVREKTNPEVNEETQKKYKDLSRNASTMLTELGRLKEYFNEDDIEIFDELNDKYNDNAQDFVLNDPDKVEREIEALLDVYLDSETQIKLINGRIPEEKEEPENTDTFSDVLAEARKKYEEENKVEEEDLNLDDIDIDTDDDLDLDNIDVEEEKEDEISIPNFLKRSSEEEKDQKREELKEMIRRNRESKKVESEKEKTELEESVPEEEPTSEPIVEESVSKEEPTKEPVINVDLDKEIYDTHSVSDINKNEEEIESINKQIEDLKHKKELLKTEAKVAKEEVGEDSEEIYRLKEQELENELKKLAIEKKTKESTNKRFKDESIRIYEQGEQEKEAEFEAEEQAMNERLEKEAIEERDKNRKEITKLFKNSTVDDVSPLAFKSNREVKKYLEFVNNAEAEGKDVEAIKKEYMEALKEDIKNAQKLKEMEEAMGINSDKKKTGKKK